MSGSSQRRVDDCRILHESIDMWYRQKKLTYSTPCSRPRWYDLVSDTYRFGGGFVLG